MSIEKTSKKNHPEQSQSDAQDGVHAGLLAASNSKKNHSPAENTNEAKIESKNAANSLLFSAMEDYSDAKSKDHTSKVVSQAHTNERKPEQSNDPIPEGSQNNIAKNEQSRKTNNLTNEVAYSALANMENAYNATYQNKTPQNGSNSKFTSSDSVIASSNKSKQITNSIRPETESLSEVKSNEHRLDSQLQISKNLPSYVIDSNKLSVKENQTDILSNRDSSTISKKLDFTNQVELPSATKIQRNNVIANVTTNEFLKKTNDQNAVPLSSSIDLSKKMVVDDNVVTKQSPNPDHQQLSSPKAFPLPKDNSSIIASQSDRTDNNSEPDFLKRPKFGGAQTVAEASPPPIIAQPLRFNGSSSMARDTVSASQDMIQSLSDLLKSQSTRQANPEIASKPTADSSKNHIESNQHSSGDKTAASFSKMLSNISPSPTDSAIANHQKQDSLKPPSSLEINADKLIAARGLNPSPPSSVNDLARSSTDTTKAEIKSVSDIKSSPTTSDKEISRDKTEHSHQDNSQSKSRPEGKSAATDNTDTSQKNQRHNEKQDDRSNKDTASNQDKSQRPSDKLSDKANDTQNKNDHKPDHKIDNKNQDQPDGKDKVQGKQIKSDQAKPDQADNNNPNLRGGKKGADNIGAKDSTIGNKANNINNKPDMLIMDETKKRADANELPPVLAIGAAALAGIARHTEKVIEEVEAIKAANKDSNGTSTKRRPYIVRLGDSLNSIAKNTLGDKRFANLILTINRARIRFKTDGTDYDAPLETGLKIALPSENEALIHKKSFFAE